MRGVEREGEGETIIHGRAEIWNFSSSVEVDIDLNT